MFRKLVASATFAAVIALGGHAGAVVIDPTTYLAGGCLLNVASCTIGIATLTAGPAGATFDEQNFANQLGLGINFEPPGSALNTRGPEIQGDGGSVEEVAIAFAGAQIVTTIQLAHFYNPDQYATDPQEVALFAGSLSGTFQVLDNSGNFAVTGAVNAAGVSLVDKDKGLWQLSNPFGSNAITSLSFKAKDTPTQGGDNSDYSIALVQTSDVPEPTTLGLLGIGLVGLGIVGKRRRRVTKCN